MNSRRNSRWIGALLTLPAACTLAACASSTNGQGSVAGGTGSAPSSPSSNGGGGGSTPTDAAGLAHLMQTGVADVTSAHLSLEVNAGQSLTGSGDETLSAGKLKSMDLTENLPGGVGAIEIIIVDGKTYAKLPSSLNKTGKPYVLITTDSTDPTIKTLATSIDSALSSASLTSVTAFVTAADSVTVKGKQTVDGVQTTRYAVVVNISKLPADLPGKDELGSSGLSTLPVDLYIDGQGRPVQVSENFTVSGQSISTKVTMSNYNKPVTISAPPADQVGTS
jgi:LppX_LprAFG lipoprotein